MVSSRRPGVPKSAVFMTLGLAERTRGGCFKVALSADPNRNPTRQRGMRQDQIFLAHGYANLIPIITRRVSEDALTGDWRRLVPR